MASIKQTGKNKYQITVSVMTDTGRIRKYKTVTTDPSMSKRKVRSFLNREATRFEETVSSVPKQKLESYITEWLSIYSAKWAETTTERNRELVKKYIVPEFGECAVDEITSKDVSLFYSGLTRKFSVSTIKRLNAVFSSFFSYLEKDEIVEKNPCRNAVIPTDQTPKTDVKSFTADELREFLDYVDTPYYEEGHRLVKESPLIRTFIWTAAFSGCRRGEIAALTWEDINAEENSIRICKSAYKIANEKEGIKIPKTATSNRTVFLPDYVIKRIAALKTEKSENSDFVFAKPDGKRMTLNSFSSAFRRILDRYNRTHENKLPESLTLHSLRHTAASLLIASGNSVADVSGFLGHATKSVTMDIYCHSYVQKNMWDFFNPNK